MPQLDVNAWPPQLFWLAVTFLVLYFIISKIVIPRTGGVIEGRKNQIDSDLASAQRFKAETEKAVAEYEKALAAARDKAHVIARETRDKLSGEVERSAASSTASSPRRLLRPRSRSRRRATRRWPA